MADVKIQILKNGPLVVTGAVDLVGGDGQPFDSGSRFALCRCGHSNKKPLCDGMHAKSGFESLCTKAAAQDRP